MLTSLSTLCIRVQFKQKALSVRGGGTRRRGEERRGGDYQEEIRTAGWTESHLW